MSDDVSTLARGILASQPFSTLVGARLDEASPDGAQISLAITEQLTQQHGFVHGGVVSYLADNAITFSGGLALGGDALTSEFKINYLKPAQGSELVARARARSVGKRQAVCQCEVFAVRDGERSLCALAQGTVVALR